MMQNKKLGRFAHPTKLVRISNHLHQLLKTKAVESRITMSFLLDDIIQEFYQIGYRPEDYQDNNLNHEELGKTVQS